MSESGWRSRRRVYRHSDLGYARDDDSEERIYTTSWVTLMGLVPLLRHCPELRELELLINATVVDIPPAGRPGKGISNRNIKGRKTILEPETTC